MKKEIYLHIAEPCHENWDAMTSVEQGRFCKSCQKQVIDFSEMNDKEVLKVLSKNTGSTCGRFTSDQLEKPLMQEVPSSLKPYKFFLPAFIPAFMLAGSATAQDILQGKVAVNERSVSPPALLGEVAYLVPSIRGTITLQDGDLATGALLKIKGTDLTVNTDKYGRFVITYPGDKTKIILEVNAAGYKTREVEVERDNVKPLIIRLDKIAVEAVVYNTGGVKKITHDKLVRFAETKMIKGRIINENGEPLPHATIEVSETIKVLTADSLGHFYLLINPLSLLDIPVKITTSYVGYEPVVTTVPTLQKKNDTLVVTMKNTVMLAEVGVFGYTQQCSTTMMGGLSITTKVTAADTIKRYVAKAFNNEMFKVFPNPAGKATDIHITFKESGTYTLQLLDNNGRLYLAKEIKTNSKQASAIKLPANISAGIYYLKAINNNSRKTFADKILIQ